MASLGPEFVRNTITLDVSGNPRRGQKLLALIAPLDGTATVAANVVKTYGGSLGIADAETDHGIASAIAKGVRAALNSGPGRVLTIGVAAKSGSPFTQTIGDITPVTTGTLTVANMPLASVTAASRDGVNILAGVKFTTKDPTTLAPAAAEVYINAKTGAFKLGTATSGSGAGFVVTYKSDDWAAAHKVLDLKNYEYETIPGAAFNAQNFGVFDRLLNTHAKSNRKLVAAALPDAMTPALADATDFSVKDIGDSGRLYLLAAKFATGDDMTSAIAAHRVADRVNGTSKMQVAPAGVTYDGSYDFGDFGGEDAPDSGTFHDLGVNAVYEDPDGVFRISNDRSRTAIGAFERFHSTTRSFNDVDIDVEAELVGARQSSSTALPYTDAGLLSVGNLINKVLSRKFSDGIIDLIGAVSVPTKADIAVSDREKRLVPGVSYAFRLAGQIHLVVTKTEVSL